MASTADASSMTRRILIGCAFALACTCVRAAEPFMLAGHALGQPYDPVLKDARYDCDSLAGCFLYSACRYSPAERQKLGGAALDRILLYFQGERLSGIEAEFPVEQFDSVADALERDYGQAAADRGVLTWRRGSEVLRAERYARPGRSSVILAQRDFIGELMRR